MIWSLAAHAPAPVATPPNPLTNAFFAASAVPVILPPTPPRSALRLLGVVDVDHVTEADVVEHVSRSLSIGRGGTIYSVNLDTLRQAYRRPDIAHLLQGGDLKIADGVSILWAASAAGKPLPERVAGSTLVPRLAARAAFEGHRVYLLGGNPGTAAGAGQVLATDYAGLQVVGTDCPAVGFETSEAAMSAIRARLTSARPDIVFVGLGFPKQERLIEDLRVLLPGAWFVSCGISFSFIVGEVRRAPGWVQRIGFEWFHRFLQEPRRLFHRYFVADAPFLCILMRAAVRSRRATARRLARG